MPKTQKKSSNCIKTGFECSFCGKVVKNEATFIRHSCKQKKKIDDRNNVPNRIAYQAYSRFYTRNKKTAPDISNFESSKVYGAFVRFGEFVVLNKVSSIELFIDYVIASKRGIDKWCDISLYTDFLASMAKSETWDRAIERNIYIMQEWATKNNREVKNFYREMTPSGLVHVISLGKVSPWTFMLSESGQDLLAQCNSEQLSIINKIFDFKIWKHRFSIEKSNVECAKKFLSEEGL